MWRNELLDRLVDRIFEHTLVPDEGEPSVRAQYALDLGERGIAVEPVEGLGNGHRVGNLSGSGMRSAVPSSARTSAGSSARISATGSTAMTSQRSSSSGLVRAPVPAARSTTVRPGPSPSRSDRNPIASAGYPGRPRRYSPAARAKPCSAAGMQALHRSSGSSENMTRSSRTPCRVR